jgi:FlaG/FlaF family flagellin (archaellin)
MTPDAPPTMTNRREFAVGGASGVIGTWAPTVTATGLSFAEETALAVSNNATGWCSGIKVFSVAIGGSPSSITDLTVDHGADSIYAYSCAVFDATNLETDYLTGEVVDNAMSTDGAETLTLATGPGSEDTTIGCLFIDADTGDTINADSSDLTQQYDFMENEGGNLWVGYRTGSTSTTVAWTDVAVASVGSAPAFRVQGIAFTLNETVSAPSGTGASTLDDMTASGTGIAPASDPFDTRWDYRSSILRR